MSDPKPKPKAKRNTAPISRGEFSHGSIFRLVREIRGSSYKVGDEFMLISEEDCHSPNILKLGGVGETHFTDPRGKPLRIEAGDRQIDSIFEFVKKPEDLIEEAIALPPQPEKPIKISDLKKITEDLYQSIDELRNIPPVPGPKGERGDPGGPIGPRGPKGERGDPGLAGKPGIPGPRGKIGERGPKGLRGERGERGPRGSTGERGPKGLRGERGERGLKGERGERGLQGKQGKIGPRGAKGEKGDRGERGDLGIVSAKFPLVYSEKEKSISIDEARLDAILKRILSGKSVSPADMGWFASTGGGGKVAIRYNGTRITPDARIIDFRGAGIESVTKEGGTITVNIVGGGSGNTNFYYQQTPPTVGVTIGSRWMDSDNGQEYVYINDGDTSQWVQPSSPSMIAPTVNTVVGIDGPSYIATELDYYIGVSYAGQVTITLPDSPEQGREIVIKDESGNAGAGPNRAITIIGADGDKIDNRNSVVLNISNAGLHMIYRNGWRII